MLKEVCLQCGKDVNRNSKYFCSYKCQMQHKKDMKIQSWLDGQWDGATKEGLSKTILQYLILQVNNKCSREDCGWSKINPVTGRVPLEINHIDGNWRNNRPNNLEVLCPCCHSITPNYGGLNSGNGRSYRYDIPPSTNLREVTVRVQIINALRAQGLNPRSVGSYAFCDCGQLKTKYAKQCRKCNTESRIAKDRFPQTQDVIDGILSMGYTGYARKFGATRKELKNTLLRRKVPLPNLLHGSKLDILN